MSAVQRVSVPVGTIPPLKTFMRHVWRFRDESGDTVLTPPPTVLTVVLDDADEADAAVTVASYLSLALGYGERVRTVFNGPHVLVEFADLHAIHAFLSVLSMHVHSAPSREVANYCLSMLGFRWT